MKRKKLLIISIAAVVLLLACVGIILWKSNVFSRKIEFGEEVFAIKDSSTVTKVFIADMHNNYVVLSKSGKGWTLEDGTPVIEQKMEELLKTMVNIRVEKPVSEKSRDNINRMMAAGAIKVEIYEKQPLFSLFKIGFFVKERKTKTYYMGPATQANVGNYAILEGMEDQPCIVYLPGFRGFLTPRYSPFSVDWISHKLFETKLTRIQKLTVQDLATPAESFSIEKSGTRFFNLYDSQNQQVQVYDTTKLITMLSEYRNRNFESLVTDISQEKRDSILRYNLFKIITLTDVAGKKTELKLYRMNDDVAALSEVDDKVADIENYYNRDRCFAILNNETSKLYKIQYFHFDRVLQPFSYYLHPQMVPETEKK